MDKPSNWKIWGHIYLSSNFSKPIIWILSDYLFLLERLGSNSSAAAFRRLVIYSLIPCAHRVLCRTRISFVVSCREDPSFWSKRPCRKTLHCVSSSTRGISCGDFSSGWLLASLARCLCWWYFRFVLLGYIIISCRKTVSFTCALMKLHLFFSLFFFCRTNSCFVLLSAVLSTTIFCKWYFSVSFIYFLFSFFIQHLVFLRHRRHN